jgi:hypothetical protein
MKKNLRTPDKVKGHRKSRLTPTRLVASLASFVLLIGVGSAVFSQAPGQGPAPGKNGKKYQATQEIILDKASGKLRKPTTEETQALVDQVSTLANRSSEGLTVNTSPSGMKSINLEGRFSGVVLGRANADGTTEVRCVFTMEEAAEFLGLKEVE